MSAGVLDESSACHQLQKRPYTTFRIEHLYFNIATKTHCEKFSTSAKCCLSIVGLSCFSLHVTSDDRSETPKLCLMSNDSSKMSPSTMIGHSRLRLQPIQKLRVRAPLDFFLFSTAHASIGSYISCYKTSCPLIWKHCYAVKDLIIID